MYAFCDIYFFIIITLGINTQITSIDKNGNEIQNRTDAEEENCDNWITNLPISFGEFSCYLLTSILSYYLMCA